MKEINNILICGLGAIGGYYAAKIFESKYTLKVLVDEQRLKKYTEEPRIINNKPYIFDYILPAHNDYKADLIIIATKSDGLKSAIKNIKNFVSENTIILSFLNGEYRQRLKAEYKSMMDKKNEYECSRCGACCKLAVSEYSYTQLKQRASRGDKFSEEFIKVFVPFESEEDAKKVNPEYFELLNTLVDDTRIYYYYCPKVKDNLCTIYESRPSICKDYPYHPLKLLPSECSFNAWKNDVSHQAMLLKAKTDIINFYKEQLG